MRFGRLCLGVVVPISKRGLDTWQSEERRERMDRLLEWYLVPQSERKPKTMKALAEQMGVTPETLRRYKKDAGFQRELLQRQRTENKVERVGDVLDMLYSQALEGNVQAAKAWLAWLARPWIPRMMWKCSRR